MLAKASQDHAGTSTGVGDRYHSRREGRVAAFHDVLEARDGRVVVAERVPMEAENQWAFRRVTASSDAAATASACRA